MSRYENTQALLRVLLTGSRGFLTEQLEEFLFEFFLSQNRLAVTSNKNVRL